MGEDSLQSEIEAAITIEEDAIEEAAKAICIVEHSALTELGGAHVLWTGYLTHARAALEAVGYGRMREALEMAEAAIKEAHAIADALPELNMQNYTEDDVVEINDGAIEVWRVLHAAEHDIYMRENAQREILTAARAALKESPNE